MQRTDANVDRVQTLVRSDRRLGVRVIAEELNMNRETVRQIVKEDFGMRKISVKMVPRILTHDQKCWLHTSSDLLHNAEMLDGVITNDETSCFQYDRETKRQSMQWKTQNSPRPKKARMSRSQVKTMLVCFFDHMGMVHYEVTAQGQTVNQQHYLEVLTRLQESVRRKNPDSGLISGFSTMTMPLRMMHSEFASSWLRTPLQKWTIHLIHLN